MRHRQIGQCSWQIRAVKGGDLMVSRTAVQNRQRTQSGIVYCNGHTSEETSVVMNDSLSV